MTTTTDIVDVGAFAPGQLAEAPPEEARPKAEEAAEAARAQLAAGAGDGQADDPGATASPGEPAKAPAPKGAELDRKGKPIPPELAALPEAEVRNARGQRTFTAAELAILAKNPAELEGPERTRYDRLKAKYHAARKRERRREREPKPREREQARAKVEAEERTRAEEQAARAKAEAERQAIEGLTGREPWEWVWNGAVCTLADLAAKGKKLPPPSTSFAMPPEVLARLAPDTKALLLEHPWLARLFAGGETPLGRIIVTVGLHTMMAGAAYRKAIIQAAEKQKDKDKDEEARTVDAAPVAVR